MTDDDKALVERLRSTVCQGNLGCHRLVDDDEAADRIEALTAENERLNKSAECLAESRRLAVKDLAVLEGHMRLETGQWKVDYDCAIMDVEHLRERIEAQAAEIERLRVEAKAQFDRGYYDGYTYLLEQHEALREALQFYAETKNWAYVKSAGCNCIDADGGDTARAALEQSK